MAEIRPIMINSTRLCLTLGVQNKVLDCGPRFTKQCGHQTLFRGFRLALKTFHFENHRKIAVVLVHIVITLHSQCDQCVLV